MQGVATMSKAKGKRAKRILIAIAIVVAALIVAFAWYVNDYYHADDTAMAAVADENGAADGVVVRELEGGALAFVPTEPVAGLVFYPGAKVQPEAYAPLMQECAEQGVLCVIVKPLFNLAILDANAADGVVDQFPDVNRWLVAGHSLGGVVASDYAARHDDVFDGIAFLASYPLSDVSGFGGKAVSIVGSNDGVLNRERYAEAESSFPSETREEMLEGGNHAYFGNYGEQAGDGNATISREEQQELTAAAIVELANAA